MLSASQQHWDVLRSSIFDQMDPINKSQKLPWPRVLSSIVGVSAAIIVGDLTREGSVSYGHALGIVGITTVVTVVLWSGAGLWQRSKG